MYKPPRLVQWVASIVLFLVVLLSLFRFIFYLVYKPAGYHFSGKGFLLGLRFDLRVAAAMGLLVLLLCAVPLLNPFKYYKARRFWNVLLPLLFLPVFLLYVVDYFHYDYLQQRLNASVLNYLHDAGISLSMVWQTYPVIWGFLLIAAVMVLLIFGFYRLLVYFQKRQAASKLARLWLVPLVAFLALGCWGTVTQFALRWSDAFALNNAFTTQLALNPVQSFFSTLSFRTTTYNTAAVKKAYPLMARYLNLNPADTASLNFERHFTPQGPLPASQKPNVVLVICESFSAYKSSFWGNPLNTTPFFDSLCRAGIIFERCFTPSYGTARGVWATITGLPDVNTPKTASRNPAIIDQRTIINDFTGYEKFYFIGGSASWANIRGLLQYNIDSLHLFEQEDFNAEKVDVWGVSDKSLFLNANKILAQQQRPFFAVIQTADNHRPYTIPEEDLKEFAKVHLTNAELEQNGFSSNEELNAFRYTDFCYRKFIEAAEKQPYFKNTVFVFIGDHGVRGETGSNFPNAWSQQGLTVAHVPLLFYSPLLKPERRTQVCSQLDVLPSVAGLVSMPYTNNALGKNLFDAHLQDNALRYSSAFFYNPDDREIGMITDEYYFWKKINANGGNLVSIKNNDAVAPTAASDSIATKLRAYAEAFYETARYLLYHNKKPKWKSN